MLLAAAAGGGHEAIQAMGKQHTRPPWELWDSRSWSYHWSVFFSIELTLVKFPCCTVKLKVSVSIWLFCRTSWSGYRQCSWVGTWWDNFNTLDFCQVFQPGRLHKSKLVHCRIDLQLFCYEIQCILSLVICFVKFCRQQNVQGDTCIGALFLSDIFYTVLILVISARPRALARVRPLHLIWISGVNSCIRMK